MEPLIATFLLSSATVTAGVVTFFKCCSDGYQRLAGSLDHTNNQASNSHRAHEARGEVIEFRRAS